VANVSQAEELFPSNVARVRIRQLSDEMTREPQGVLDEEATREVLEEEARYVEGLDDAPEEDLESEEDTL
jgi:hypothetical protein